MDRWRRRGHGGEWVEWLGEGGGEGRGMESVMDELVS